MSVIAESRSYCRMVSMALRPAGPAPMMTCRGMCTAPLVLLPARVAAHAVEEHRDAIIVVQPCVESGEKGNVAAVHQHLDVRMKLSCRKENSGWYRILLQCGADGRPGDAHIRRAKAAQPTEEPERRHACCRHDSPNSLRFCSVTRPSAVQPRSR